LITASIKGVKGGNFEPLQHWYSLLIENCLTLADLLHLESEQFPDTAKLTFVKVLASLGCGFYSYNLEVCEMTFQLFIGLFREFTESRVMFEQALKWFLHLESSDEVGQGGLKLSLYALKTHMESARNCVNLLYTICMVDEQLLMILKDELQNHTRSNHEYIVLIADLLPFLHE